MLESYPSYYWVAAQFVQPLQVIDDSLSNDQQLKLVMRAIHGLDMLMRYPEIEEFLPRTLEKATPFKSILLTHVSVLTGNAAPGSAGDYETLQKTLTGFNVSLQDELDRLPMFTVTKKGNLDIRKLVEGIVEGYPKNVLELIDDFVKREIDYAGRCLAFELPTSCGFHILRAVETCVKGFCFAETGKLPPVQNRNWGQYIDYLKNSMGDVDIIDILRMLKTKRNPLMHPTETLDTDEAISLLCICQGGIEAIIGDIRKRSLEVKFKDALANMPNL